MPHLIESIAALEIPVYFWRLKEWKGPKGKFVVCGVNIFRLRFRIKLLNSY